MVEVGGVEFLSQLRLHCDPALHSLIDDILEQLLKLPTAINQDSTISSDNPSLFSSLTSFEHPEAVYGLSKPLPMSGGGSDLTSSSNNTPLSTANTGAKSVTQGGGDLPGYSSLSTSDVGSYMEISRESFGLRTATNGGRADLPSQHLEGSNGDSDPYSTSERSTQLSSWASPSLEGGGVGHLGGAGRMPYTESMVITSGEEEGSCVAKQRGTFPWLCLTDNDRNILTTTQRYSLHMCRHTHTHTHTHMHSRLQSCTDDSLIRSCEFIQDVLFQDFPAEVFLQRPALLKVHRSAEHVQLVLILWNYHWYPLQINSMFKGYILCAGFVRTVGPEGEWQLSASLHSLLPLCLHTHTQQEDGDGGRPRSGSARQYRSSITIATVA